MMVGQIIRTQTIRAVRKQSPSATIEILTPDFLKVTVDDTLEIVVKAKPDVFNHNLETVPGLYPKVRPGARYFHSLRLCKGLKSWIELCLQNPA